MSEPRSIAIISPQAWPPNDDLTWRIEHEAAALARRGHAVSILTSATGADLLADGRRRIHELRAGDERAVIPAPGSVLVVPLGRALPAGTRRRIGGPIDLATTLEDVLSRASFDVVHLHEPLSPSPALAALRHARGITAATFSRPEQLAGVAFVQPLLERAMGRIDVWLATSDTARRTVTEFFARTCEVVPPGVDIDRFRPQPPTSGRPGLVIVARAPDRAGLRFAMRVLKALDLDEVGPVTVLAPGEAPWRSRATVPKALRDQVTVIPDTGPDARVAAFAAGRIALIGSADELVGSAVLEAMACGCATVIPRSNEGDALIGHGQDGLALAPFSRDVWAQAITDLARDAERRGELGARAAGRAATRTWDDVAADLEAAFTRPARAVGADTRRVARIVADLRVHPGPELGPRELVDACLNRDIGAVAVIGDDGPELGLDIAAVARERLVVIPGQHIRTRDGALVGLFLRAPVPHERGLEDTVDLIHAQGGIVVAPHPGWTEPPSRDLLRRHRSLIDCYETLSGPASVARAGVGEDAARLAQRFGSLVVAGSGASAEDDLGCAHLRLRPFTTAREFLDALADAEPVQRRRGLRVRTLRERRHPSGAET